MLKEFLQNLKKDKKTYNEWQDSLNYFNNQDKKSCVITHIRLNNDKRQFLLIYKSKSIFFMEKEVDKELQMFQGTISKDLMGNEVIWECIKASKTMGSVILLENTFPFLVEKMELYAGYCGFNLIDEINFWRNVAVFMKDVETNSIDIPTYIEKDLNQWVD